MTDTFCRFEEGLTQEGGHCRALAAEMNPPQSPVGKQLMRNVEQSVAVRLLTVERKIMLRFLAVPNPFGPSGNVIVIVILVEHRSHQRGIYYGGLHLSRGLDEPLIEPESP